MDVPIHSNHPTDASESSESSDGTIDPISLIKNPSVFIPDLPIPSSSSVVPLSIPAMTSVSSTPSTIGTFGSVTTLDTGTFNDWKLRLTTILGAHRLSKDILRDVEVPTDEKGLEDYETNSMRALVAIHATIDPENFEVIRSCQNPQQAFLKLCKHHDDAGGLSTAHLFSDLVTLRLAPDGDLKAHIHKFRKLHNDPLINLSSTPDIKISEPFVAIIFMNSLPSEYTPLVQSLLTNFETLTLTRLYSLLNIEATRNAGGAKDDTALMTSRFNPIKKQKKKSLASQSNIVCSLGHPGHTDEQCKTRQWRGFKEYQEMKSKTAHRSTGSAPIDEAQMTQESKEGLSSDISYFDTAFSAATMPTLLETGATNHMFGDKSLFSSLHPSTPSQISVASKNGTIWSSFRGRYSESMMTHH